MHLVLADFISSKTRGQSWVPGEVCAQLFERHMFCICQSRCIIEHKKKSKESFWTPIPRDTKQVF